MFLSCGRRNRTRHWQHETYHGTCSERFPSILFVCQSVLDSDFSHQGDRFLRGVFYWFAQRERIRVEFFGFFSLALRSISVSSWTSSRYTKIPIEWNSVSVQRIASTLANIAQRRPVTAGYGIGRGNGERASRGALCSRYQHVSSDEASVHVPQSCALTRRCDGNLQTPDHSQVQPMRITHPGCLRRRCRRRAKRRSKRTPLHETRRKNRKLR